MGVQLPAEHGDALVYLFISDTRRAVHINFCAQVNKLGGRILNAKSGAKFLEESAGPRFGIIALQRQRIAGRQAHETGHAGRPIQTHLRGAVGRLQQGANAFIGPGRLNRLSRKRRHSNRLFQRLRLGYQRHNHECHQQRHADDNQS